MLLLFSFLSVSKIVVEDEDMVVVLLLLFTDLPGESEEDAALNQFDILSELSLDGESDDRAIRVIIESSAMLFYPLLFFTGL